MKKVLIISPHFPPSNLAGVHRTRLFAQHLASFDWIPTILTVHESYYEEELDGNLVKLVSQTLRIEKVKAFELTKPRTIGDIGLRGFYQLYKKAKSLIISDGFDIVYISIPSFYPALIGRWLHASTGIKYGIDYIDPWVHNFPGSDKILSRHWFTSKLARFLEPIAVKKAVLITGVAEAYYQPVLDRNPHLINQAIAGAMPYGGEELDHKMLASLELQPYLFKAKTVKTRLMYAGAMLPKAYGPLESIFKSIVSRKELFSNIEFHFVGTGSQANNPESYNIRKLAEKYGLWHSAVFEYPQRIPYLDVLVHLQKADGIFILGSTEPHYTPSKAYQGILSAKPILAVLHRESNTVGLLHQSGAAVVLDFHGENDLFHVEAEFGNVMEKFLAFLKDFDKSKVKHELFKNFSAKAVTGQLANLLDKAVVKDK